MVESVDGGFSSGSAELLLDGALIGRLREDLRLADWTVDHVDALLSPMA